jgi:riboflavin kinase/FMN adenylyltransferase
VERILVKGLGARAVLVGDNFHFGRRQTGTTDTLRQLGARYGFGVDPAPVLELRGITVSSSAVRSLIESGNVSLARRLLGRPFWLEGEVIPGRGVGSKQTVPTLNLSTAAEVLPLRGVYVTETLDLGTGRLWPSITNVGHRPTFDAGALSIETFLLEPLDSETPRRIRIQFLHPLREERKFESPEALRAQILRDAARANAWFRRTGRWIGRASIRP